MASTPTVSPGSHVCFCSPKRSQGRPVKLLTLPFKSGCLLSSCRTASILPHRELKRAVTPRAESPCGLPAASGAGSPRGSSPGSQLAAQLAPARPRVSASRGDRAGLAEGGVASSSSDGGILKFGAPFWQTQAATSRPGTRVPRGPARRSPLVLGQGIPGGKGEGSGNWRGGATDGAVPWAGRSRKSLGTGPAER